MKKSFMNTELWKWIRTLLQIAGFVLVLYLVFTLIGLFIDAVHAEAEYETAYAICVKDDVVNVRATPKSRGEWIGWLEPGDKVTLDGRKKNGYVHCIDMNTESGDGWVFAGYLTEDPPVMVDCDAVVISKGRLAARKYVGGKRTKWLKANTIIHVYYMTDEWCSTNNGYVQTKYLKLEDK